MAQIFVPAADVEYDTDAVKPTFERTIPVTLQGRAKS